MGCLKTNIKPNVHSILSYIRQLSHSMSPALRSLTTSLFSGTCLLCQVFTDRKFDLCALCEQELPYLSSACIQCATPLPMHAAGMYCGQCLLHPITGYRVFSVFAYHSPIDRLVSGFKFHHRLVIAKVLGTIMAEHMQRFYQNQQSPQVIIPVPLHRQRLRERGFNQALELARPINRLLKIPLDYSSCKASSTYFAAGKPI